MTQTETESDFRGLTNHKLGLFKCKICGMVFEFDKDTAWEIHKLNHTLVALKNIIDRAIAHGDRLY